MTAAPTFNELERRERCDVLLAGDTHGNIEWCLGLVDLAGRLNIDVIIQLGDFGFFEHYQDDIDTLDDLNARCTQRGVRWLFIDGNHDNHDMLAGLDTTPGGYRVVRDHIWYLPRGHRFQIAGFEFGCLGGAYSIDLDSRTPGISWFATETISPADVDRLGTTDVDILLTHDMPTEIGVIGNIRLAPHHEHHSYMNRRHISEAVGNTHPKLVIHGHWHARHATNIVARNPATGYEHHCRVEGLSDDGTPGGWAVLRLPDMVVVGTRRA